MEKIRYDEMWGHTVKQLTNYHNADVRGRTVQWLQNDHEGNYHPKLSNYLPADFTYQVNRFGYRGPEIDHILKDPSDTIMYVGCSFTFGVGCPYEDTWAYRLHEALCRKAGKQFKYLNLGTGGGGMDYIARTVHNWTPVVKPIAVFFMFPDAARREVVFPETDRVTLAGPCFPPPVMPSTTWLKKKALQAEWDKFGDAFNILSLGETPYVGTQHYLRMISTVLGSTPWYWSTWNYPFEEYVVKNPQYIADIADKKFPLRLEPLGSHTINGHRAFTGRDGGQHPGLAEARKFVDDNIDFIKPFWE